jgi:energy-coupling factor transport system substrate-specific component
MSAFAVVSRILFAFTPGFKPLTAIVIITGAVFKKEAGFMVGSLSSIISNMFFGQGPWTIYQMLINGFTGYIAGAINYNNILDKGWVRYPTAFAIGFLYSIIIDFLGWVSSGLDVKALFDLWIPGLTFAYIYGIANMFFLFFLYKPMVKKLTRVKIKYGIVDDKYRIF